MQVSLLFVISVYYIEWAIFNFFIFISNLKNQWPQKPMDTKYRYIMYIYAIFFKLKIYNEFLLLHDNLYQLKLVQISNYHIQSTTVNSKILTSNSESGT